jgi:dihydrofolate synthase/folylpolyglutamate synthase
VPLLGLHQADNLAVALAAAEAIEPRLATLDPAVLRSALRSVRWPGRIEILGQHPLIVADAAINEESARLALAAVSDLLTRPIVAVAALPEGKDLAGVCRALAGTIDRLILTRTRLNRILVYSPDAEAEARRHVASVTTIPASAAALAAAKDVAGTAGSIVVIGTQSLIAEIQIALDRDCLDLW